MNFKQLKAEGYAKACYMYLISLLALRKQKPVSVARIDNAIKTNIIIFKKCQNGKIDTKSFKIPKEEAPFFTSWLSADFPSLEFKYIKGDKA